MGAVEAFINGAWTTLITSGGTTSTITLGTSASATNPQRNGQAGTGFYSDASNVVEVAIGGSNVDTFASTGESVTGTIAASSTATAAAFIPTGSTIPANGLYLPAANTLAIAGRSLEVASFTNPASAVNYLTFSGAITGSAPTIGNAGTDTNGTGLGIAINGTNASAAGVGGRSR